MIFACVARIRATADDYLGNPYVSINVLTKPPCLQTPTLVESLEID